jgi:membrane associated rhomboid family serine protease
MSESDRHIEYKDKYPRRRFILGQPGNPLMILFTINVVAFLLLFIFRVFYLNINQTGGSSVLEYDITQWVSVPGNFNSFLHKPWTLLTYMFAHGDNGSGFSQIILIASNMLWLWTFGFIFQDIIGEKQLIPVYLLGGVAGAVFFMAGAAFIPPSQGGSPNLFLLGAHCSIAAIVVSITYMHPNYKILRNIGTGIPIWALSVIYLLLSMLYAFGNSGARGMGIIGGALAGLIFIYYLRRNRDITSWMNKIYNWIQSIFGSPVQARKKIFYKAGNRETFTKRSNLTPQRIDEILYKINSKGFESLTSEEKELLKKAGEELE